MQHCLSVSLETNTLMTDQLTDWKTNWLWSSDQLIYLLLRMTVTELYMQTFLSDMHGHLSEMMITFLAFWDFIWLYFTYFTI